jgi:hypothetical protein
MSIEKHKNVIALWTGNPRKQKIKLPLNFQLNNCFQCIRIIEVIHNLQRAISRIELHHNSNSQFLKESINTAMTRILDIIAGLNTI